MANEPKGKPSGIGQETGTGTPQKMKDKDLEKDKELTQEFTDKDREIADNVQTNNPNRNTDKTDATNAGGYRN